MIFVGILFPCLKNKNWRYSYACHLFCDKPENLAELHDFALHIGLKREWFQDHSVMPHYDLTAAKKMHAIRKRAIEVDQQTEVKWIMQWRRIKKKD